MPSFVIKLFFFTIHIHQLSFFASLIPGISVSSAFSSCQLHTELHTVLLLNANFNKIKKVCEVVMASLSLLQLCICQLFRMCTCVWCCFSFWVAFKSDFSRVSWMPGLQRRLYLFYSQCFSYFRSSVFFFIATMKVLAQIVAYLVVVAYLQGIRVYAHFFISLIVVQIEVSYMHSMRN